MATSLLLLSYETVHFASINISNSAGSAMGSSLVPVFRAVEGLDAVSGVGVKDTGSWPAVFHRNSFSSRIGAKIMVKCPILLHYDDDMLDFVNARILADGRRSV